MIAFRLKLEVGHLRAKTSFWLPTHLGLAGAKSLMRNIGGCIRKAFTGHINILESTKLSCKFIEPSQWFSPELLICSSWKIYSTGWRWQGWKSSPFAHPLIKHCSNNHWCCLSELLFVIKYNVISILQHNIQKIYTFSALNTPNTQKGSLAWRNHNLHKPRQKVLPNPNPTTAPAVTAILINSPLIGEKEEGSSASLVK